MFRRRKPEEASPGTATTEQKAVQPAAGRPAGSFDSIFSSSVVPRPSSSGGSGTVDSLSKSAKEPPMGRAPLPPGSPLSPGSAVPPIPGAARMPQQPSASMQPRKDHEQRTLVVGRGISVQGTVQEAERLVVEGTVESSMIVAKELIVMPGGLFRGSVEVENAEVAGTVDGTLTARGSLSLRATGRLLGKAACRRLKVEDGGQITGQLEMLSDDKSLLLPSESSSGS